MCFCVAAFVPPICVASLHLPFTHRLWLLHSLKSLYWLLFLKNKAQMMLFLKDIILVLTIMHHVLPNRASRCPLADQVEHHQSQC